jgi:hypothetical protein
MRPDSFKVRKNRLSSASAVLLRTKEEYLRDGDEKESKVKCVCFGGGL